MLSYNFSGEVTINERIQRRSDRWSSKNEADIQGSAKRWALGCVNSPPQPDQSEPGGGIHAT